MIGTIRVLRFYGTTLSVYAALATLYLQVGTEPTPGMNDQLHRYVLGIAMAGVFVLYLALILVRRIARLKVRRHD